MHLLGHHRRPEQMMGRGPCQFDTTEIVEKSQRVEKYTVMNQ
jgi:hypothetical protein